MKRAITVTCIVVVACLLVLLAVKRLATIYSGEIDNWKDVGGVDAHIEPAMRETR